MKLSEASFPRAICNYRGSSGSTAAVFRPSLARNADEAEISGIKQKVPLIENHCQSTRPAVNVDVKVHTERTMVGGKLKEDKKLIGRILKLDINYSIELSSQGPQIIQMLEDGTIHPHGNPALGIPSYCPLINYRLASWISKFYSGKTEQILGVVQATKYFHPRSNSMVVKTSPVSKPQDMSIHSNYFILVPENSLLLCGPCDHLTWVENKENTK